jgi:hypothetical protein
VSRPSAVFAENLKIEPDPVPDETTKCSKCGEIRITVVYMGGDFWLDRESSAVLHSYLCAECAKQLALDILDTLDRMAGRGY